MKTRFDSCHKIEIQKTRSTETHYVIYVEYQEGIPHDVRTVEYIPNATNGPYWCLTSWDFFAEKGCVENIKAYESGGGGNENSIYAPNFIDGYLGEYWLAEGVNLIGSPKNAKRLDSLKIIESYISKSTNPFDVAEIAYDQQWCPKCNSYSEEFCNEHLYYDNNDIIRYKGNHKCV